MIRKIMRVVRASRGLVKSFDLASKEKYLESLNMLNGINDLLNGKDEEYHILKAFLYLKTGRFEDSIAEGRTAFNLIAENSKLNESERLYLKIYLSRICRNAYDLLGEKGKANNISTTYVNVSVDLSEVSGSLKKNFPL